MKAPMSRDDSSVPSRRKKDSVLLAASTTSFGPTAMLGSGGATAWSVPNLAIAPSCEVPAKPLSRVGAAGGTAPRAPGAGPLDDARLGPAVADGAFMEEVALDGGEGGVRLNFRTDPAAVVARSRPAGRATIEPCVRWRKGWATIAGALDADVPDVAASWPSDTAHRAPASATSLVRRRRTWDSAGRCRWPSVTFPPTSHLMFCLLHAVSRSAVVSRPVAGTVTAWDCPGPCAEGVVTAPMHDDWTWRTDRRHPRQPTRSL